MSENCIKCSSSRIVHIMGKTSDMNTVRFGQNEHDGYVPDDLNISKRQSSDNINFDLCLECGTIQAEWPLPISKIEKGAVNFEYDLVEGED